MKLNYVVKMRVLDCSTHKWEEAQGFVTSREKPKCWEPKGVQKPSYYFPFFVKFWFLFKVVKIISLFYLHYPFNQSTYWSYPSKISAPTNTSYSSFYFCMFSLPFSSSSFSLIYVSWQSALRTKFWPTISQSFNSL